MEQMTIEHHAASAAAAHGLNFSDVWRYLPVLAAIVEAFEQPGDVDLPTIKTWSPSGTKWIDIHVSDQGPRPEPKPPSPPHPGPEAAQSPQVVGE